MSEDGAPPRTDAIDHETIEDLRAERVLLDRAIGGWRGIIDTGLPTLVFVAAYVVTSSDLLRSVIAALVAGVVIVVWRLIRREPLQQVLAGFLGVLISAAFTKWTGKAENFFAWGLVTNIVYGTAFLISVLVRWPLLGIVVGYLMGEGTGWRQDLGLRRRYALASWFWVGLFFGRLVVQVPMYAAGAVGLLGVTKIVMGWPLFLATAYLTYLVLRPVWEARRETGSASEVSE